MEENYRNREEGNTKPQSFRNSFQNKICNICKRAHYLVTELDKIIIKYDCVNSSCIVKGSMKFFVKRKRIENLKLKSRLKKKLKIWLNK